VSAKSLRELLQGIATLDDDIVVRGLTLDSRRVRAGDAFIALQGAHAHGVTFAPAALAQGAAAILAEAPAPAVSTGPIISIDHLRDHVGEIAARFFDRPTQSLHVIGVTGTNGKTSIVQLLAAALETLGARAATIGTLGAGLVGALDAGERTTPDAVSVQALLAQFRNAGATHTAMEVSSHALEQGRVNAVAFEVAVFTNLTRDHLDYHGTMENYGAAKAKLFAWPDLRSAIINADDAFGRELIAQFATQTVRHPGQGLAGSQAQGRKELLRYAVDADADVRADNVRTSTAGLEFTLTTPWGKGEIASPLLGRFNVYNLLAVAGCLGTLGYTFAQIQRALAQLKPVAGRMNRLGGGANVPLVVVDYAHTPDALEQALTSLRAHCAGRLTCVFGCGGERDRGKRPQMGLIASRLADWTIITDDNPRGEDGDAIVDEILTGFDGLDANIERDRAAAIAMAIDHAKPGDIVLIAGKGHEPYQEIGGKKFPFDDLAVARQALEAAAC
jgi:UDP-N-acetylmuramoyl-L-alanyl-D-glutamate--2,6-diaminopimelate ligase